MFLSGILKPRRYIWIECPFLPIFVSWNFLVQGAGFEAEVGAVEGVLVGERSAAKTRVRTCNLWFWCCTWCSVVSFNNKSGWHVAMTFSFIAEANASFCLMSFFYMKPYFERSSEWPWDSNFLTFMGFCRNLFVAFHLPILGVRGSCCISSEKLKRC